MTTTIVAAALGGFFAWLLGRSVTILVLRMRLLTYLTTVLNVHFRNVKDNQSWLTQALQHAIVPGRLVDGAPMYTKDALADVVDVRLRCLELLTRKELVKLTKCFNCLWEIEVLFAGFCESLRETQDRRETLSEDDVVFFHKRAQRLNAHIDKIPAQIRSISELEDDYAGTISAATLVIPAKQPEQKPNKTSEASSGSVPGALAEAPQG